MNFTNPKITVITACYNSGKTIETTLKSMLSQTYKNFEYLIIDGKSSDNTLEIVEKYREQFGDRLRIISEKDNGIYDAMNKGVKNSTGVMIGILNSDDYYCPDTLARVAAIYEQQKYPFLVINGDLNRVDSEGNIVHTYHFGQKQVDKGEFFGHPSMFAAKAVYDKIGLYDLSYRFAADGDWQYRAHDDKDVKYLLCPSVFNNMREGGATDELSYRYIWFKERVRMRKSHKRGNLLSVYVTEIIALLGTDIKAITPKRLQKSLYSLYYKLKK